MLIMDSLRRHSSSIPLDSSFLKHLLQHLISTTRQHSAIDACWSLRQLIPEQSIIASSWVIRGVDLRIGRRRVRFPWSSEFWCYHTTKWSSTSTDDCCRGVDATINTLHLFRDDDRLESMSRVLLLGKSPWTVQKRRKEGWPEGWLVTTSVSKAGSESTTRLSEQQQEVQVSCQHV